MANPAHEFTTIVRNCHHDTESLQRFLHVFEDIRTRLLNILHPLKAIADSAVLAQYAHDKYLPACKAYREYIHGHPGAGPRDPRFRKLTGAVGGTSRKMYSLQRETFHDVIKIMGAVLSDATSVQVPDVPGHLLDHLWHKVKTHERLALAHARKRGRR
ncbi:MAG: hypothetical protein JSV91_12305 [Phycisphaerales bacterium]|nr:MAG: hypothetical protein JSV91_12305 [Phycisphaerales bacterium]